VEERCGRGRLPKKLAAMNLGIGEAGVGKKGPRVWGRVRAWLSGGNGWARASGARDKARDGEGRDLN